MWIIMFIVRAREIKRSTVCKNNSVLKCETAVPLQALKPDTWYWKGITLLTQVPTIYSDRKTCQKAGVPFLVCSKKTHSQFLLTFNGLNHSSYRATEQIFFPIIFSPQVCLFCTLLTTYVPLVQLINNVFYCYRQTVLLNTIAGKAWQDCRVQVFGVLWSSKPDAEEMEHLFPFFSALENTALCRLQKQPDINSTAAAVFPWQCNRDVPSTAFASSPLSAQTHVLEGFLNFFSPRLTETFRDESVR